MVLIGDQKHACQTCIKGHRSSNCNHADRPLFPIKRKGRPTTQCDHCRELRKTRRVHVKCLCGSKNSASSEYTPSNLPKSSLNPTSDPMPPLSDGSSSDSDHSSCSCGSGQDCHCCIPRESSDTAKPGRSRVPAKKSDVLITPSDTPPTAWFEPDHSLPTVARHKHNHNASSPYGQAYAAHHQPHIRSTQQKSPTIPFPDTAQYDTGLVLSSDFQLPPLCSCNVNCSCPGCTRRAASLDTISQCNHHETCSNCFDCSVLPALPAPQYDLYPGQDIDSWLRQATAQSTEQSFSGLFIPDFDVSSTLDTFSTSLPSGFEGDLWTTQNSVPYSTISSFPQFP